MSFYGSQKDSSLQKCEDFKKCCCTNLDCSFIHEYKYCYNYQNATCNEKNCPFLHCTSVEQYRYIMTGKTTENLKKEVGRTLQNTNICGDFKNNVCKRSICNRRHVKLDDLQPLECPICRDTITLKSIGVPLCGHMFCYNCGLKCLSSNTVKGGSIVVYCPMCRSEQPYKKLM
ncbi:zinc finger CCCH domain-containing protein 10-like [Temnothorax curvispinosus]|uniref:Zinc finger CCCH domain-containing protein 10-like n=1 Tax=Temnothorax curvispinosus TaxID=300111 RepID=A0A6J1PLE2_9HYME|nr:zinc finger CCCH domain-containing protein 10-like [Temnothorax curvispinosus]